MKKYLIILFVLIASIGFSQTEVCFRSNVDYKSESVVIIQSKELSPVLTNMGSYNNDNSIKMSAMFGYVLLNSFVITEYFISNKSWKEQHPNPMYWNNTNHQNHVSGSGYPNIKKPSPLGMVSTLILSTGLVVTIFISF